MKRIIWQHRKQHLSLKRYWGALAALLIAGLMSHSALASVKVADQPLTMRQNIPPNIMVVFDDSGSMRWDFMPDAKFLESTSDDALAYSGINGVYYNPNVNYVVPQKAAGGSYPNTNFSKAPVSGYDLDHYVDLTKYKGKYEGLNSGDPHAPYSISVDGGSVEPTKEPYQRYGRTYYNYSCPDGYDLVGSRYYGYKCEKRTHFFYYTTQQSNGDFTKHYVGKSGSCTAAGLSSSVCDDSDEERQNVANWFSYYHTRFLTAKSAMMRAFSGVNKKYRIGYMSINKQSSLVGVKTFGDGSKDTRKEEFWDWLAGISNNGGTPLRKALKAVGKYYQGKKPWQSKNDATGDQDMLACRPSYTIMMTDGFWNSSSPDVGNADKVNKVKHPDADGVEQTVKLGVPYKDDYSNTLADVAMYYWKNDLRSDISNEVPTTDSDPAFWQHMTTFTLGLGWTPQDANDNEIDMTKVLKKVRSGQSVSVDWPKIESGKKSTIADLAHAGLNGHGGFFSASNTQAFVDGLRSALASIDARQGTNTGLSANSSRLQTGTAIFQSQYKTDGWSGDVMSFGVDKTSGNVSGAASWHAANQMPAAADRNIVTWDGSDSVAFNSAVAGDFGAALGADAAAQSSMIAYIRGSHADEQRNGGSLRNRSSLLGDIINSQPVFVGKPRSGTYNGLNFTGKSDYAGYASSHASRPGRLYVAANDGMLHAFDADTGKETFAYLPAAVIKNGLKNYAQPDYGTDPNPHQFYNDGRLAIADAYYDNGWHTVLVGTTGRGPAKAIYALDVTDPNNTKVLWEKSAADNDYIGQITGEPVIAQVGNGKWAVLVGNGFNSAKDSAALLQFSIKSGTLTVHKTDNSIANNGLSTPSVWIGKARKNLSTVAYAGDIKGNIWSFDLSDSTSDGTKLYTAKDDSGDTQAVTMPPLAAVNPDTGDRWLFFGTGRYLSLDDFSNTSVQTWYGIVVKKGKSSAMKAVTASSSRADLAQRKIIKQTTGNVSKNIPPARIFTTKSKASSLDGKAGWYIDLTPPGGTGQGERMVKQLQYIGGYIVGASLIPKSDDVCNPSGSSWLMALDPFTGTNPEDSFFDMNHDGSSDDSDKVDGSVAGGLGSATSLNNPLSIEDRLYISDTQGKIQQLKIFPKGAVTYEMTSWRELLGGS